MPSETTTGWSVSDVMQEVYGDPLHEPYWDWDKEILSALHGLVRLDVVIRVVQAAHAAYAAGAASETYD